MTFAFQWKVTISSFSVEHKLDTIEDSLDNGLLHFMQSFNQLEYWAIVAPQNTVLTDTFGRHAQNLNAGSTT